MQQRASAGELVCRAGAALKRVTTRRVPVESPAARLYAAGMSRPEILPALHALLATPAPPALDAAQRSGTLPAAEVETRVRAALLDAGLPAANADLVLALLLLWHDHLDAAHTLAQGVENADGSFVHAILHRREPDAWNAKYWWRRVGAHPAFAGLARRVGALLEPAGQTHLLAKLLPGGRWDASAFVDACEAASAFSEPAEDPAAKWLREIQRQETEVLLAHLAAPR